VLLLQFHSYPQAAVLHQFHPLLQAKVALLLRLLQLVAAHLHPLVLLISLSFLPQGTVITLELALWLNIQTSRWHNVRRHAQPQIVLSIILALIAITMERLMTPVLFRALRGLQNMPFTLMTRPFVLLPLHQVHSPL
jgi:hypothetical protein